MVEGGGRARRAALGWLVQAVFQSQTETGDLLLQLSDGLAGVEMGQKQRAHVQCPELRPPPEGLPDAPGLSLSCGPQVQLCRELILELPRVSFFLATYLHTYEFTSLYIWWVKQHILRGSPNPPPLCCAGSLVALLKHQRHIVKIEGRMQNEEGIAEGPL